jgi:hypothetical protein
MAYNCHNLSGHACPKFSVGHPGRFTLFPRAHKETLRTLPAVPAIPQEYYEYINDNQPPRSKLSSYEMNIMISQQAAEN